MSENLFPREDWEGENEFLEYTQFLFLETPSQETAVARSPVWHCDSSVAFLPSWNPNTECWEARSAKFHCLAFLLRARMCLCFSGKTDGWGALVSGRVGSQQRQADCLSWLEHDVNEARPYLGSPTK